MFRIILTEPEFVASQSHCLLRAGLKALRFLSEAHHPLLIRFYLCPSVFICGLVFGMPKTARRRRESVYSCGQFSRSTSLFVNTRVLLAPLTGVQRYVREVLAAWPGEVPVRLSPPDFAAQGIPAHLWEQLLLPRRLGNELLWSPVHSGPVSV